MSVHSEVDLQVGLPRKINTLSPELLSQIFEYVYDTSPATVNNSLASVNRTFWGIARRFRYRKLSFNFLDPNRSNHGARGLTQDGKNGYSKVKDILKNADILPSLRSLTITSKRCQNQACQGTKQCAQDREKKWSSVNELVSKVTNLKEIVFKGNDQVPVSFLITLEKSHPNAKLDVENWCRRDDDGDHNDPAELALALSPNLRSIKARFWYTKVEHDLRFAALKRIIALSPSVQSVEISEGHSGCSPQWWTMGGIRECERLAKFFALDEPSTNTIKELKVNRSTQVMDLRDINLADLERLELAPYTSTDWSAFDGRLFKKLKHFKGPVQDKSVMPFLLSLNPLETLVLTGNYAKLPLSELVEHHGSSLRTIVLHQWESTEFDELRDGLKSEDFEILRKFCPYLEDVTIDLSRSSTNPPEREIISNLASFPNLTRAGIHLDLGIAEEFGIALLSQEQIDCMMSKSEIYKNLDMSHKVIWTMLQQGREKRGLRNVRELDLKVGELEREMGAGYPPDSMIWESDLARHEVIRPPERDDEPNEISVCILKAPRRL